MKVYHFLGETINLYINLYIVLKIIIDQIFKEIDRPRKKTTRLHQKSNPLKFNSKPNHYWSSTIKKCLPTVWRYNRRPLLHVRVKIHYSFPGSDNPQGREKKGGNFPPIFAIGEGRGRRVKEDRTNSTFFLSLFFIILIFFFTTPTCCFYRRFPSR